MGKTSKRNKEAKKRSQLSAKERETVKPVKKHASDAAPLIQPH